MNTPTPSKPDAWECFQDAAYYDMWCVRPLGCRTFGEGFHLSQRWRSEEPVAPPFEPPPRTDRRIPEWHFGP
jgi:hypothetical protein